jgi:manganese/zinc/iron transport system ATP- binding protein
MAPAVDIRNVTVAYHDIPVLFDICATIPQGILLAVVGPNGAGKSTLLKTMVGLIKPQAGTISLFGTSLNACRSSVAYIPQRSTIDWDFPVTVFDVVLMGRYGHVGWLRRLQKEDIIRAEQALEQVQLLPYKDCPINELSGGQQQRVFLARALAQDAQLYIMDEPFVAIDTVTETIMISILKALRNEGKTMIIVHHDLHTVTHYFDWMLLLNVKQIACGPIPQVYTADYLGSAYGKRIFG